MVEPEFISLMHHEIDGVLSTADRERLKEYLQSSQEARTLYGDLTKVVTMLGEVEAAEPSPNLKKNVLNAISRTKYQNATSSHTSRRWLSTLMRKPKVGFSMSFAVGLACGIILFAVFTNFPPVDQSEISGSMISTDSAEDLTKIDGLNHTGPDFSLSLEVRRDRTFVFLFFEVKSATELKLVTEFDRGDLRFRGLHKTEAANRDFTMVDNKVTLTHSDENRYVLGFQDVTPAASSLSVKIFKQSLVYQDRLSSGRHAE